MPRFTIFLAAIGLAAMAGTAQAMPAAAPLDHASSIVGDVRTGCGPGLHLDAVNRCVANHGRPARRRLICPRGTHLAPSGRRCLPNRF